jgi:large subunit ribosomal protein L13
MMRTFTPSGKDIPRDWYVVDADGMTLGRLATRVASVLRGKHKPTFAPHLDMGDHVIVVNADRVVLTGAKSEAKVYHSHSGYPGGLRSVPFLRQMQRSSAQVVETAVRGMLPKNSLGRSMILKLKVYPGPDHPHAAQQPKPLPGAVTKA